MKKENIEYLQKFESNFNTAIKSNYTRAIPSNDKIRMKEILKEETGENFPLSLNCSLCTLKLIRKVGELYFKTLKEKEKECVELEPTLNINELENKDTNTERKDGNSGTKGKKKRKK